MIDHSNDYSIKGLIVYYPVNCMTVSVVFNQFIQLGFLDIKKGSASH